MASRFKIRSKAGIELERLVRVSVDAEMVSQGSGYHLVLFIAS